MELPEISKWVKKIDYDWFLQKKIAFQDEPFYDSRSENISHELIYTSTYEDENGNYVSEDDKREIRISLFEYCWNSYYPDGMSDLLDKLIQLNNTDGGIVLPIDLSSVSYQIINRIDNLIGETKDSLLIHKIIMTVLLNVRETINLLNKDNADDDYSELLNYFINKFRRELYKKYGNHKIVSLINDSFNETNTLKFELNQEELAALLFILDSADFLYKGATNDTSFLSICKTIFRVTNQKKGGYTVPSGLEKKFSESKNYTRARDNIKNRLKEVLKNL